MHISRYLTLMMMLSGLTKSQLTVRYGDAINDGSCIAQYSEMSLSLSKIVEDVEELKETLITAKNESQYQMFYTKKSWIDADLSCFLLGGHLVSFEDLGEIGAVSNMITEPCSEKYGFWTAGRDIGNSNWIWRNSGDPIKAELWQINQPNDQPGCAHLWTEVSPYRLADYFCERTMCYICEI